MVQLRSSHQTQLLNFFCLKRLGRPVAEKEEAEKKHCTSPISIQTQLLKLTSGMLPRMLEKGSMASAESFMDAFPLNDSMRRSETVV